MQVFLNLKMKLKNKTLKTKIFYVERRINISGFLKSGNLLPFQPINLEQNLEKLYQPDKYFQFTDPDRTQFSGTGRIVIINTKNIDKD